MALALLLGLLPGILRAQSPPSDNWTFPTNLDSWSFLDLTNWTSDDGYAPISFTNIISTHRGDIKSDFSLVVDTTNTIPAWLHYKTIQVTNSVTNLTLNSGAITFWFSSASWASASTNGTGPGQWAELLSVGQWTTNASIGYWGLFLDPGATNIYFASQDGHGSNALYLSASISWNTNEWHFIVLTYSATNSALYLDDILATNGPGIAVLPGTNATANGFFIGSDSTGLEQARGMFDDIYTFANPINSNDVEHIYDSQYYDFFLNPYNATPYAVDNNVSYGDGTNLWLNLLSISNNLATLLVADTLPDVLYEIQGTTNLSPANWVSEAFVYGSEITNWTAAIVAAGTSGNLFLRTRSWQDTTGSGVPDWWWLKYFSATNVNPWAYDPSGDGFTYLDDYLNGFTPGQWNTPAAPTGLTAQYHPAAKTATINWVPSPGPIQGYTVQKEVWGMGTTNLNFPAGTTSFTDNVPYPPSDISWSGPEVAVFYSVQAHYAGGDSSWSTQVPLENAYGADVWSLRSGISAQLAVGQQNAVFLTVSGLPPNAATLRIMRIDTYAESGYGDSSFDLSQDFPVSVLTNGVFQLPASLMSSPMDSYGNNTYDWWLQTLDAGGNPSAPVSLGEGGATSPTVAAQSMIHPNNVASSAAGIEPLYFFDGRQQLAQNLNFLLRVPTLAPFNFVTMSSPINQLSRTLYPPNYVYAGLYQPLSSYNQDWGLFDPYRPYEENYTFHNFVFTPSDLDTNGELVTGVQDLSYPMDYQPYDTNPNDSVITPDTSPNLEYVFQTPTNAAPVPPILDPTSDAKWTYFLPLDTGYYLGAINVTGASGRYYMTNNGVNYFGLPFVSALFAYNAGSSPQLSLLSSNSSIPAVGGFVYPQAAMPQLQTVGYYFAEPSGYSSPQLPANAIPGNAAFSPTNTTQLLCAGFGQPVQIAGYAKQQLLNGYSGVYGFLGQYFEYAYTMGTNGQPTTNSAGIISPYGTFLPTNNGPAVLVTMTNWGDYTGQRGTAVVQVVSLNVDANHDGTMDLSFGGPDQTSQANPYRFWINNDHDFSSGTGDGYIGHDVAVGPNSPWISFVDHTTVDYKGQYIECLRDLEDWARLWICGVPALTTNAEYQVTLSMNASSGDPAINLVNSVETNGGTGYLTDTNVAAAQVIPTAYGYPGYKFAHISSSQPYIFPANSFTNGATKYLLFEGAGIGVGQLTLTISQVTAQGTNVLAQTSTWLDIHDISDFFEQAYATNVTSGKPPSSLVSDFSVIQRANSPAPDETKQVIVFIHGINNTITDYQTTTRTIFKRLYWAGYHGRFASFRWPCAYLPWNTPNPFKYNLGEFYAFKSATALKNYLSYLRNNRPDLAGYDIDLYAHSQGNVVTSEAVLQGAPFDNYILTQGAFPAHCYDTNAPFLQKLLDAETNSVNAMQTPFYPVDGGYHGYCLPIQGNLINFYNTNDFALASGVTAGLQTNWEEDQRAQKPEAFIGGPSYLYDASTHITTGYYTFGSSYTVTDLQEIKALVARSRSRAVGAQGGLHGAIRSETDLLEEFGFGNTRSEHSAQFNRPIQTVKPYWEEVVRAFNPPTP
ncbi:MAG TPA: alpha/beta hydrolase [Candidatus Angelobacter sp.]|nr:alpha/beta hydrolase [Candidatus Angelobacter sp.]